MRRRHNAASQSRHRSERSEMGHPMPCLLSQDAGRNEAEQHTSVSPALMGLIVLGLPDRFSLSWFAEWVCQRGGLWGPSKLQPFTGQAIHGLQVLLRGVARLANNHV
eukprot:354619-Chlamydomonas_euryale.AAC.4